MVDCAICLSRDGFDSEVRRYGDRDADIYICPVCGVYALSKNALNERLRPENLKFTRLLRAVLSHRTQLKEQNTAHPDIIMTFDIDQFVESSPKLPTPSQQAMNAIRFIGEYVQAEFQPLPKLPPKFQAVIGAPNRMYAQRLIRDLADRSLLTFVDAKTLGNASEVFQIDLTLNGWDQFEVERRGNFSSNLGFIALKFGDDVLDPFVRDVIKPGLLLLGFELIDLRDVSKAGVIDNILRAQIRDAAFVIVDLTHDNYGAYWEAGYAEGLGKPVIYICERAKFDDRKTHFDTNHCTTVLWSLDDPKNFVDQLSATVRRSLGM